MAFSLGDRVKFQESGKDILATFIGIRKTENTALIVRDGKELYGWIWTDDYARVYPYLHINEGTRGCWWKCPDELELVTPVAKSKLIMRTLTTYLKRQLDQKTRKLYRADLINGELKLTEQGREELIALLYFEHKDELVKRAEEIIEKAKKKEEE